MGIISLLGSFMAMQFEKQPSGYLYRANGKGPPLPATEAEFERFVRRGGISFALHVAAFMLGVIAAAMVTARWFPEGGEAGGFVVMGGLLVANLVRALSLDALGDAGTGARTGRPGARSEPVVYPGLAERSIKARVTA